MEITKREKVVKTPISIQIANSFGKRFLGLMFRKAPLMNEGLLLKPCNSIHMFFMFISIDVVFLDKEYQVIRVVPNVKPWTVIFPVKNAVSCLELPIGTISTYEIAVGDKINTE
ncbi:uncharacterized membrane protein (UPF0127 family) [Evansella vedderi]|uniref:Uncharacterized membrane protein (UPF0127 family) n=1 Tax=Evansella vedderi TaxID=38282 RepID=A0ABT9ZWZ6_9BACI|nr:DUF192 domain-containing protein [Evansella vedderi]MDQ0255752.1 uncharacterized membrane protein (UPF0127 family) [Evansella vedderi]